VATTLVLFLCTIKAVQVAMNAIRFQDLPVCDTMLAYKLQLLQAAVRSLYKCKTLVI